MPMYLVNYQPDWIMRQIQFMVQGIAKLIFHQETTQYEVLDESQLSAADRLFKELEILLDRLDFNEAEDLLFERIDPSDKQMLLVALNFYDRVNEHDDKTLAAHHFSRDEIEQSLEEIKALFHLSIL